MGLMDTMKKLGLVEDDSQLDLKNISPSISNEDSVLSVQVPETQDIEPNDFVQKVYDDNGLSDISVSVYKISELIEALPENLTTKTKQDTIKGLMAALKLDTESIICDSDRRVEILSAGYKEIAEECQKKIDESKADIEKMKGCIEQANQVIDEANVKSKVIGDTVRLEISKIANLKEFIGGMENESN